MAKIPNPQLAKERYIRFSSRDLLVSTNRLTDGESYERLKNAFNRLRGTTINTNIKTGGLIIEEGFGLIDAWRAVKEDKDGRVIAAEIRLSDWCYNAILSNELLTISRDYFRLRKPIERRIYELARKHCGDDQAFKIGLAKLHKKTGSSSTLREFRRLFGRLLQTDHLPDYAVSMDADMVTFTNRNWKPPVSERQSGWPFLKPETFTKAKAAAPGWDVYHLEQGVDPTVVSPTAISITANQGSVYIEVEPTLPSRKCQEDIYDLARYASRNENSDFILTLPGGSF